MAVEYKKESCEKVHLQRVHQTGVWSGMLCTGRGGEGGLGQGKVLGVRGNKVEVKLLDAGRNMELPADTLGSMDCHFRFKNFVDEALSVNLVQDHDCL